MHFWSNWRWRLFGVRAGDNEPGRAESDEPTVGDAGQSPQGDGNGPPGQTDDEHASLSVGDSDQASTASEADQQPATDGTHVSPASTTAEPPAYEANVPARQERAAGLILDDEGLRGDLSDDEFQPLLTWALAATDRVAERTADFDDEAAHAIIDEQVPSVKDAVRLAAEAIGAHAAFRTGQREAALDALTALVASASFQAAVPGVDAAQLPEVSARLAADATGDGLQASALVVQALAVPPIKLADATVASDEVTP